MKLSNRVKPISYIKSRAPEVIRGLAETGEPVVVTLRGEAKAVLQDLASFEQTQETLALLKILALANKAVAEGRVEPTHRVFARIRRSMKT